MRFATLAALLPAVALGQEFHKGFNYDAKDQTLESFTDSFNLARNLVGTSGFTSARLFTMVQFGTQNTPISAIEAAIDTNTTLLLGLWYHPDSVQNELTALRTAMDMYGEAFANLVVGISVGSEDLYRNSPTGIAAGSDVGATAEEIIGFIQLTREAIQNTILAAKPVGHVDTWTAYVDSANAAVIGHLDFVGLDTYPYYQQSDSNSIANAPQLFDEAYQTTLGVAQGKPIWITETGWPVEGPASGLAETGVEPARQYWREVGCDRLFDKRNTWWYILRDGASQVARFRVTDGTVNPIYDLSCPAA